MHYSGHSLSGRGPACSLRWPPAGLAAAVRILARGERPGTGVRRGAGMQPGPRRGMGAAAGFVLMAVGAVLALAVPGHPLAAVNLRVVGIILIVTGVLRLLLVPVQRGAAGSGGLGALVNPSGFDDPGVHDDQTAAAIDVANIRDGEVLVSPDAPGNQPGEP
jgi:hypothetical protein